MNAPAAELGQRARILDAALALMGAQGAAPTSMRQLASACEINVATLYHYFPSKSELLAAVVAERGYLTELAVDVAPIKHEGTEADRLARMLVWIWNAAAAEDAVWKLLLGEAVRHEDVAIESARTLVSGLAVAVERWLGTLLDDPSRAPIVTPALCDVVLGGLVHETIIPEADRIEQRRARARAAAAALAH